MSTRSNYRTRQQNCLIDYLTQHEGQHFTAAQIHAHFAEGDQSIGTATVYRQLEKLVDVKDIKELKPADSVYRELVLIKIRVTAEQRQNVLSVANIFRANIIDVSADSVIVELTGNQSKIEAFLKLLEGYEILEIARTGIAGLCRGTEEVVML